MKFLEIRLSRKYIGKKKAFVWREEEIHWKRSLLFGALNMPSIIRRVVWNTTNATPTTTIKLWNMQSKQQQKAIYVNGNEIPHPQKNRIQVKCNFCEKDGNKNWNKILEFTRIFVTYLSPSLSIYICIYFNHSEMNEK